MPNSIHDQVRDYYTEKIQTFGISPQGVDWSSEESQYLRFDQLLKVVKQPDEQFSILDYGCGFGSMYKYMKPLFPKGFHYTGYDISTAMLDAAAGMNEHAGDCEWVSSIENTGVHDYVVESGIFNVRLENSDEVWLRYILDTLEIMHEKSGKGFAFNVLTKYSDKEYMREYLYYADPEYLFEHCKRRFSKYVALLHDYPLYEFTILVRK